jgi:predicted phage terminase large subunit-like protein
MAKYLNKFARREIRRLMIFAPPRYGKSELTSRRLPALLHGMYPNDEILAMSYNSELASDMTIDVQRIMDRPAYQEIFPFSKVTPEGSISKYARSANEHELIPYKNEAGIWVYPEGSYRSAGLGGAFTGRGGQWVLIDDPVKNRQDADSRSFRDQLYKFYTSSLHTRLEGEGSILLTQTCWHVDDLAGRLLALQKADPDADQWTVLRIPAIKEDDSNPEDPREIGEPLWPQKFGMKQLMATKANSSRDWAALFQQRPTAEGGNIIQSSWIKYYKVLPEKFDQMIQSWDFAVKDKNGSDYTVGQVWGRIKADKYLIYQFRARVSFPVACQKLVEISKMFPQAHKKLIEAKANGPAVVQTLRQTVPGLVEVEPFGDKVSRLNSVAPDYESGNVYYPTSNIAPWIDDHVSELCDFPNAAHDDSVDAASQALKELRKAPVLWTPIAGHSGVVY